MPALVFYTCIHLHPALLTGRKYASLNNVGSLGKKGRNTGGQCYDHAAFTTKPPPISTPAIIPRCMRCPLGFCLRRRYLLDLFVSLFFLFICL